LIEGDYGRAIEKLTLVNNEQPTFSPAQFFLVVAYLEAGEREKASNTLDIYLRNHPEDESARALMAREFSDRANSESLRQMASGMLSNAGADAESLVQAALPMFIPRC
jgi:predicted Zn-dependent protease